MLQCTYGFNLKQFNQGRLIWPKVNFKFNKFQNLTVPKTSKFLCNFGLRYLSNPWPHCLIQGFFLTLRLSSFTLS